MDSGDFDRWFLALCASVERGGYSKRVKSLMMPDHAAERARHARDAEAGRPCGCRICYFARGRSPDEIATLDL